MILQGVTWGRGVGSRPPPSSCLHLSNWPFPHHQLSAQPRAVSTWCWDGGDAEEMSGWIEVTSGLGDPCLERWRQVVVECSIDWDLHAQHLMMPGLGVEGTIGPH